jgi:small-conductance mechanosensitive channel
MDNLKHDRLLVQEAVRQQTNANLLLQQDIDQEKAVVARFDQQLDDQRRRNYDMNDYNLDLLNQTEALEAHMRLLMDQNRLLEDEIDKVIKDDDAIA